MEQKTRYNSGEQVLLRINELWKEVHTKVSESNYITWDLLLDRVWSELINLMDDKELEQYSKEIEEVNKRLEKTGRIIDNPHSSNEFKEPSKEENTKRSIQYSILMGKEKKVRQLQRKVEKKVISSGNNKQTGEWD